MTRSTSQMQIKRGGTFALLANLALLSSLSAGARAADPPGATIRPGETVAWSGGPLTGTATAGPEFGLPDRCTSATCHDFMLDVRVPSPADPGSIAYVQVRLQTADPNQLSLFIYPPPGDTSARFVSAQRATRLLAPQRGTWRIRVACTATGSAANPLTQFVPDPCLNTTFAATATTGAVSLPVAIRHRAGGVPDTSPFRQPAPRGHIFDTGVNGLEPSIGLTSDGTIFTDGGASVLRPWIVRSTDRGKTWADVSPTVFGVRTQPGTLDPILYADKRTSRVFSVQQTPPPGNCVDIAFTDDGGHTWTTNPLGECGTADHETLFAGPPVSSPTLGYPNVVYYCAIGGGDSEPTSTSTSCDKSLDGSLTFAPTGSPAFADPGSGTGFLGVPGLCDGASGHGVVGADGTVYLPKGWCGEPWIAISHDEGFTWTRKQVANNGMPIFADGDPDHEARAAVDAQGNVYYLWVAHDRLAYLSVSRDEGKSWSQPLMVAPPGVNETSLPAIDVGASGKIAMVFLGTKNSPGPRPDGTFPGEGDCPPATDACNGDPPQYANTIWNGYLTVTDEALAPSPLFVSVPVNDSADPLIRGACGPIRCQAEFDFIDVIVGPDGTPWGGFVDGYVPGVGSEFGGAGLVGRMDGGPSLR